jgi:glycosidase
MPDKSLKINQACARETVPWLTKSVMYQIFLRSFTPEGTLAAATKKLPQLAELGVDVVYLCPFFVQDDDPRTEGWSPRQKISGLNNPKNPYRIKDYYNVDPEHGTDSDLREFVETAHRLKIRVIFDIVFLHCGPNAVFIEEHPDYVQRDKNGETVCNHYGFPLINFESDGLREYLWKNLEYWIENFSVDGYRVDVADQIPLDFMEKARTRLEKLKPDVIMLAEGKKIEHQLFAYDLNYMFPLHGALIGCFNGGGAAPLRRDNEVMSAHFPRGARFIRYLDNHDLANESRFNRIEDAWKVDGVDAALVMTFTLDGMPMLYNGQEVADRSTHSIYGNFPVQWERLKTPEGKQRFAFCQKLCRMRHEESVLANGETIWLDHSNEKQVLAFTRELEGKKFLVVINLTKETAETVLQVDGLSGTGREILRHGVEYAPVGRNGKFKFSFGRFGYLAIEL